MSECLPKNEPGREQANADNSTKARAPALTPPSRTRRRIGANLSRLACVLAANALWLACGSASTSPDQPSNDADSGSKTKGPSDSSSETPLPGRIQEIEKGLSTLLECPDRIWSGESWSKRSVLLVSKEKKTAYLWNAPEKPGKTRVVNFDDLPSAVREEFVFNFLDFEGAKVIAVSLDISMLVNLSGHDYIDFAIPLAIHEGFHVFFQQAWPNFANAQVTSRAPIYPDKPRLRFLRRELVLSLRASLLSDAPLGAAAHWRNALRAEFPEELTTLAWVDNAEGTARFVEGRAVVLAKYGCSAASSLLPTEVEDYIGINVGVQEPFDSSDEPYHLGNYAVQLLEKSGHADYVAKLTSGATPVDLLLESVAPLPQVEDAARLGHAISVIEERNAKAKTWIDPLLAALKSTGSTRVVFPTSWYVGSYKTHGSYRLANEPNAPEATSEFIGTLMDPTSLVSVSIDANVLDLRTTPCGLPGPGGATVVVVPTTSITLTSSDTRLTSSGKLETFELPVKAVTDDAGRSWLCPVGP